MKEMHKKGLSTENKSEFIHRGYGILTWVEIVDGLFAS